MPRRTCVISTRCATSSTSAWRARAARRWLKAVSTSCPIVRVKSMVEVAKARPRLQAATYRGEDGKGQPFIMTAGSAVQKSSSEPIVRLPDLAARLQMKDGPADVTAPRGAYDMKGQQVRIDGPVKVVSSGGYTLDTNDATLDLKTRHLRSASAVTGTVPQGQFSGNRRSADLDNHVVTLDGNARLRIVPRRTK